MGYYRGRHRGSRHQGTDHDHPHRHGPGRRRSHRRAKFNVPVNIIEFDDRFECHIYAFGFAKDQINITVSDNAIYVSGRREPKDDRPNFLLHEFPIRIFERSFELSDSVDQNAITASQQDGILIINAPKHAEAQQPDIKVEIG